MMAALTALALADSDSWQEAFLAANLSILMLLSVFNAVFQGAFTANLGPFPEKYMGSFMSGQVGLNSIAQYVLGNGIQLNLEDRVKIWCFSLISYYTKSSDPVTQWPDGTTC